MMPTIDLFQNEGSSSMYLDNSHTIEIEAKGLMIRRSNTVQPNHMGEIQ